MKTFRAIADGYLSLENRFIAKDATFNAPDDFDAAPEGETPEQKKTREAAKWYVEVDGDHAESVGVAGAQETLDAALKPAVPELENAETPLPDFHPTIAVPDAGKVEPDKIDTALADAALGDPTGTPVVASGRPNAHQRREQRAKDASKAEHKEQKELGEGNDLV